MTGACSLSKHVTAARSKRCRGKRYEAAVSGHLTPECVCYTWPGSNWPPSACEADLIATRPQVLVTVVLLDCYTVCGRGQPETPHLPRACLHDVRRRDGRPTAAMHGEVSVYPGGCHRKPRPSAALDMNMQEQCTWSTCGLVAMTSAQHAEGRQLDPGQVYAATASCPAGSLLGRRSHHIQSTVGQGVRHTPGQDRTGDLQHVRLTS